jgi:putative OPT family oligopeptide transporter
VRYIGIGGIFAAGVLSILKMSPVIVQALRTVGAEMKRMAGQKQQTVAVARTERDLSMTQIMIGTVLLSIVLFAYFRFAVLDGRPDATSISLASLALTLVIAFLFAAVSAWAVATISITPVSGMTLTTLIISAVFLAKLGLSGTDGMLAVLLIGGVVCTALSMTGSLVTLFKVGYWIGATPKRIQLTLIAGSVLASITVTGAIVLFAHTHGFTASAAHPNPMPAPQANAMAAVIQSVMASAQGAVVPVRDRRGDRGDREPRRHLAARLRARHVPADGSQHSAARRGDPRVAGAASGGQRAARTSTSESRHAHRLGADRGRCARWRARRNRDRGARGDGPAGR